MKPVLLIAVNFVREQRWPIFVLLLWVLLLAFLGLFTDVHKGREDLLFVFKQVAVYVVVFSVFFGGSAIYNERKTRRILAVLSKGVDRRQYLSGLVLGISFASAIYCFALGLTGTWTLGEAGFPISHIWLLMAYLVVASMLAGTVALLFSTFLNPFLAAGATASVLGIPALMGRLLGAKWGYLLPVYMLTENVTRASFRNPGSALWLLIAWALVETLLFWILGAQIFSYVDIAIAVE